jgi:precorrin-6B methylase 2
MAMKKKSSSNLKRIRLDQEQPKDGITLAVVGAGTGSVKLEDMELN